MIYEKVYGVGLAGHVVFAIFKSEDSNKLTRNSLSPYTLFRVINP